MYCTSSLWLKCVCTCVRFQSMFCFASHSPNWECMDLFNAFDSEFSSKSRKWSNASNINPMNFSSLFSLFHKERSGFCQLNKEDYIRNSSSLFFLYASLKQVMAQALLYTVDEVSKASFGLLLRSSSQPTTHISLILILWGWVQCTAFEQNVKHL